MKIKPLGNRIVVVIDQTEGGKTRFGLYLPENAKEKPQTGTVLGVADGVLKNGVVIAPSVKVGDVVLFAKYSGTEIKLNDEIALIVKEEDILAVVEK